MEKTDVKVSYSARQLEDSRILNIEKRINKQSIEKNANSRYTGLSMVSGNGGDDNVMQEQRRRLEDPLRLQKENFSQWNQEDFEKMRGNYLEQDFTNTEVNEQNIWEYGNFNPGGSYECPSPQTITEWRQSKLLGTNRGLLIRSQIIKTMKQFSLRTLALNISIKGRLFGNSMFWIFTRVNDNIEAQRPVCILKKMPDSQRVFCIFGQMVEKAVQMNPDNSQINESTYEESREKNASGQQTKLSFKFFKNQEIPEFFYNLDADQFVKNPTSKALNEDYVDFHVSIIDNGDDKVCLQVGLNDRKTLNLICQMFLPVFEDTRVMFAGSGHATYLKEVKIRQQSRQDYFKSGLKEGHFDCCCNIF